MSLPLSIIVIIEFSLLWDLIEENNDELEEQRMCN